MVSSTTSIARGRRSKTPRKVSRRRVDSKKVPLDGCALDRYPTLQGVCARKPFIVIPWARLNVHKENSYTSRNLVSASSRARDSTSILA
ncbi:unnamed protein product [Ectocarpus sp. 4 AP-2014]